MKPLKQLCIPRDTVFDPQRRDTVLDLADLLEDRIHLRLKTELPDYWADRDKVIRLLDYLAGLRFVGSMPQWGKDAEAAGLLAGAARNDHV